MRRPARTLRGFTLVEMVVTLVVAGLVLGIAGVSMQAVLHRSQDVQASSTLDRVVLLERTWGAQHDGYSTDALSTLDRDLSWTAGTSTSSSLISAQVGSDGSLGLAVLGANGCAARVLAPAALNGAERTVTLSAANCAASSALAG